MELTSPILFFKAGGSGEPGAYTYWTISKKTYQIQADDVLEYDIFIDSITPMQQAAVDVHLTSGKSMRQFNCSDQNGILAQPYTNLEKAAAQWYHRKIALNPLAGKTADSWQIAFVGSLKSTYIAAFANIQITRNGQNITTIYAANEPECSEKHNQNGFDDVFIRGIANAQYRSQKMEFVTPVHLIPEIGTARLLQRLMPEKSAEWEKIIQKAVSIVDVEAYLANDEEKWTACVLTAQNTLSEILHFQKKLSLHLTGHAHIDMNWLWVWDETLEVLKRDFANMMALMEEFPQYKYSHSQAATYRAIETNAPELFSKLKKFVQNKQWEITASMWVEGDENLASGEALVRQFLLGKRYIMEKFDVEPTVCWQPDLFGHIWTMPQIIKKCGCDYYFFMRCAKPNTTAFWWQGPDGSKVLAYNTPNYNGIIGRGITQLPMSLYQSENISEYLHAYGVGDHGGGPNRTDVEKALELQDVPNSASIKFNTVAGFFEDLQKKSTNLPVVQDELQFIFEGCYTTRADIKQRNRQSENLLPELELFSSMAQPFEFPYPNHVLRKGWERTCFNHFHDILPGSGIHAAYQESLPLADGVIAAAESSLQRALDTLAAKIKSDQFPGKSPVTIFNSTNWERSDIAKFDVSLTANQWVEIYDVDNSIIPCQIVNRNADTATVLFIAQNIPAAGYKTYFWLKTDDQPKFETDLTPKGNWTFENHYIQIQVDPATGAMTRIMDKINSTEYIEPGQPANIFQLNYEKPNDMSAWLIGDIERIVDLLDPDKVEVLESGPVRMMIQITHRHDHSEFKQRIVLYSQLPRIDFPCQVEWFEKGSPEKGGVMLKVVFPLNLSPDNIKATFDIPFGYIEREANGQEVPAQKWIDVADAEKGISLLNDSKYGHDVQKNIMRLSLLRSSFYPDDEPDLGIHRFSYSLVPHAGNWQDAHTAQKALDFNLPLRAVTSIPRDGNWPCQKSFLTIAAENIIVSALKKAEDSSDLILRCYEVYGKTVTTSCECGFDITEAMVTDMIERNLDDSSILVSGNRFSLSFTPFEIKTIRLKRPKFTWPIHHGFIPV